MDDEKDIEAAFRCNKCHQKPTIRPYDRRWISIKCGCHMVIVYPSNIVTEIKAEDYVNHHC